MTISIFHPEPILVEEDDSAFLMQRIDEDFGIDCDVEELAAISTAGELHELILSKLTIGDSCRSSRMFYRLRRALADCLGIPRQSIRPSTNLAAILPRVSRITTWKSLEEKTYLTLPELRRPLWVAYTVLSATVLAAALSLAIAFQWNHSSASYWVGCSYGIALICLAIAKLLLTVTTSLAVELPSRTVGELTQTVLAVNFAQLGPGVDGNPPLSRSDVWKHLVQVCCHELALRPDQLTPEAQVRIELPVN